MSEDFDAQHRLLCDLLRALRQSAGLRQSDLAKRLRKPQSFVSKYESGSRRLDIVELRFICRTLGISLEELVRKWESSIK